MPPTFPHAVFTPEDCLAVGGQFYTAGLLGQTIEGLKLQEDHPEISNEDLSDSVYRTLGRIVRECNDVTTSVERAHITSSSSQFRDPLTLASYGKLPKSNLIDVLRSRGTPFTSEATRDQLIQLLSQEETAARKQFREEIQSFCRKILS